MTETPASPMIEKRVSMFVSHKVDVHGRAARRIKAILESRAERLDVYISEETLAGDRWREWIRTHIAHSQILLVLVPQTKEDLSWLDWEIATFQAICPEGRLVILRPPSSPIPSIVADRQTVEASRNNLLDQFIGPLYRNPLFAGLDAPLNGRITSADLRRDAGEIERALRGVVDTRPKAYGETLVVETVVGDVMTPEGLDAALVEAPNGCTQILDWQLRSFSWSDLRERAAQDTGKGTFWVSEMEQVIREVARHNTPRIMTSTFRGRGPRAGQIFRPQLESVDFVDDRPVRYRFFFHEVLVPELVRGPDRIGDVFSLLHVATRVRWEVLNPFLVKLSLSDDTLPARLKLSPEEQSALIGQAFRSLRIIDQEADRHNMFDAVVRAFDDEKARAVIVRLLKEREQIHREIATAAQREEFEQFMGELTRALTLNVRATELLADRFLELVREDRIQTEGQLQKIGLPSGQPLADVSGGGF